VNQGTGSRAISRGRLVPFLVGTALGNAGDMFTQIAVFWTGLKLTGTALSLAELGGVWTLSAALMGLISGPFVDRFNRRSILAIFQVLLAVLSIAVGVLAWRETLRMWHLMLFLIGEALLGTPVSAAFAALLPDLVPENQLVRVNGLLSSWGMSDNLVEAAAGGIVLAIWGPTPIFLFTGVMFLVGAAAAFFVPRQAGAPHSEGNRERWRPIRDLRISVRYILRERLLRRVICLDFVSDLVFAPLFFLPALVATAIGLGSEGYGFLQSLTLGGVLAASLLASSIGAKWPKFLLWIGGNFLIALSFLVLSLHMKATIALIAYFLFGIGIAGGRVYGSTLIQQVLPSKIRGRVNGISGFLGGVLQPVALAVVMALVETSSVDRVLIWLSVLMLAIAAAYLVLLPRRDRDWSLSDVE